MEDAELKKSLIENGVIETLWEGFKDSVFSDIKDTDEFKEAFLGGALGITNMLEHAVKSDTVDTTLKGLIEDGRRWMDKLQGE